MADQIHVRLANQSFSSTAKISRFSENGINNFYNVKTIRRLVSPVELTGYISTEDGDHLTTEGGDSLITES